MLSLRHLTIFKTVSETGNFTRAAEKLYITQSAVSHAILELEACTDTILFDRLSRKVRLTAGGKLLLEEITPILASCEALEGRIKQLNNKAPIHIVSSITIASYWLPVILRRFKERMPEIPVYVTVVPAADAVNTLKSGDADLALLEGAEPQGPFCATRFGSYPLRVLCSPDYAGERAGFSKPMTIKDFCSEPLLLREPGSAIRDTLDSALFLLGYTVWPLWTSVNSTALIEAAKAGLGVTVLPEILVRKELQAGALCPIPVEGLSLSNNLIAVWHKDKYLSSALQEFLTCVSG